MSPLRLPAWERGLANYPDSHFAHFILRGISKGFRIGVQEGVRFRKVSRNLVSAYEQPQVVQAYMDREVSVGRMFSVALHPSHDSPIQLSPFGVIPKNNKPNKWRLKVDLSSPKGRHVNDAISKELCSIAYVSLDDAVAWIQSLGRGCLLAKLDLREAYRAIPVHPSDQRLLGFSEGVHTLLIESCHLACGQPQRFSQR